MTNTPKLPVMKTVSVNLPGGFVLERQEPDGENYYTQEMIDDAIRELTEPHIKEALATLKAQVRKEIEELKVKGDVALGWGELTNEEFAKNQTLNDCLSIPSLKEASDE